MKRKQKIHSRDFPAENFAGACQAEVRENIQTASKSMMIGADQVLGFDNQIFNKPVSRADAEKQL